MRTTTAYFAGVGTVVAAVVAGLGGGLLMAKIVNPPKQFAETTRLEQRTSSKSIPVVNASSEPVSYLAATEPATSGPITVVPPAGKPQPSETVKAEAPAGTAACSVCAAIDSCIRRANRNLSTDRTDQAVGRRFHQSTQRRCGARDRREARGEAR